ncbi:hypothetical protein [Paenibacillus sacheonensis]|uniref:DUF4829 domain-containing protein n=1 Tax=Paenibacillus sacheonensis TaxID=742054 RepID=A0A7X5BZA6_9BACL|nr:hypothetical protein [Paenibacillus sacheonensis]MBM7564920.1 hypothetical protein [Paenibacillus sacheonensis]NBC70291.1 hypothetical protein [Paenibacillus sacheonensis]
MRRSAGVFVIISVLVTILWGCGSDADEEAAAEAAKAYLAHFYEVTDYPPSTVDASSLQERQAQLQPYATEEWLESLLANRVLGLPFMIAQREQAAVSAQDIQLSHSSEDEDVIAYTYRMKVMLRDDAKEMTSIPVEGSITLAKTNGTWKVNNDINRNRNDLLALTTGS